MKITEKNLLENELKREDESFGLRRSVLDNTSIIWGYYEHIPKVGASSVIRVSNKSKASFILLSSGLRGINCFWGDN